MKSTDSTIARPDYSAELELRLQEALAQRQRAADLFGEPDWDEEVEAFDDSGE